MKRNNDRGMSILVKCATRIVLGFIILYGIYIALNGHVGPGGGFAGGALTTLGLIGAMLAFGKEAILKKIHSSILRKTVCIGSLIFFLSALGTRFSLPPSIRTELIMPLSEMLVIGAGLFAIFIALVFLSKADKNAE